MKVKMSDKGGLLVDRMAHTLMEFRPIPNTCGALKKDGYEAFYHEYRLYSVRHIKSGAVILVYANNPYTAIEKCKMLGYIENFHAKFDVEKVIAELEQERDKCYEQMKKIEEKGENETDYFDGHIFDEYHNQGIGLNKAIDIINKYLSYTAEPPKTD